MGFGESVSVEKVDESSSGKAEEATAKEEDPYDIVKATQVCSVLCSCSSPV